MRLLILAHELDPTARCVAQECARRGGQSETIGLSELRDATWHHVLARDGSVVNSTNCHAAGTTDVVLNRLGGMTVPAPFGWTAADAEYARAEFLALLVSWLTSLGSKAIDPPFGSNLAGASPGAWAELRVAAACGLRLFEGGGATAARSALVVGKEVLGAPECVTSMCLAVARGLRVDTLRIQLVFTRGGWTFAGCERLPPLTSDHELDALFRLLEERAR